MLIVLLAAGSSFALETFQAEKVESAYRAFTVQDRTIEARVVRVDMTRGTVTLELENKQRKKVKISIFGKEDQAHILEYAMIQEFKSSRFKIEVEKEVLHKDRASPSGGVRRDVETIQYQVKISNNTALKMKGVRVAYNVFYEQEELGQGKNDIKRGQLAGVITLKTLAPREKIVVNTKTYEIYSQKLTGGYTGYTSGAPTHQSGKSKGVWLKVFLKTPSGLTATKEICLPKNTSEQYQWGKPSTEAAK